MFHFPTFPPLTLCVQVRVTGHDSCRVSPFGNPRITARLTAPRGLSQPPTSFIGSWCQGIHRAPLLTWPQRCSRPLCSSQDTGGTRSTHAAYPHKGSRPTRNRPDPTSPTQPARTGQDPKKRTTARSLRTQQRAKPLCSPNPSFHAAEATVLNKPDQQTRPTSQRSTHEQPPRDTRPRHGPGPDPEEPRQTLLRKEVIQPHLPVRLPCYDFVPIADPTFDSSPPRTGWATGFGCYRLS